MRSDEVFKFNMNLIEIPHTVLPELRGKSKSSGIHNNPNWENVGIFVIERTNTWWDYNTFTFFFFAHYTTYTTIFASRSQAGYSPVTFTLIFCYHYHTISSLHDMKNIDQQFSVAFKLHSSQGVLGYSRKSIFKSKINSDYTHTRSNISNLTLLPSKGTLIRNYQA